MTVCTWVGKAIAAAQPPLLPLSLKTQRHSERSEESTPLRTDDKPRAETACGLCRGAKKENPEGVTGQGEEKKEKLIFL